MSRYLALHTFKTEFDGDTVTMQLRPLDLGDALRMQDTDSATERAKIALAYVSGFTGLKDANGAEVSVETAFSALYFVKLLEAVIVELLRVSVIQNPEKSAK